MNPSMNPRQLVLPAPSELSSEESRHPYGLQTCCLQVGPPQYCAASIYLHPHQSPATVIHFDPRQYPAGILIGHPQYSAAGLPLSTKPNLAPSTSLGMHVSESSNQPLRQEHLRDKIPINLSDGPNSAGLHHSPLAGKQGDYVYSKDKEPMEITKEKILEGYPASNALKRIRWTDEESSLLADLVKQHGAKNWTVIARNMGPKTARQCRDRWINVLRPDVKGRWSEEEVRKLIEAHKIHGNRWVKIAKHTQGRSDNAVRNYFNSIKRMKNLQLSRTENEERPRSSVLKDYINTLATQQPTSSSILKDYINTLATQQPPSSSSPPPPPFTFDAQLSTTSSYIKNVTAEFSALPPPPPSDPQPFTRSVANQTDVDAGTLHNPIYLSSQEDNVDQV